jgi:uncharacterized protein
MTKPDRARNSGRPLLVLLVGTCAMGAAWHLTPEYGPWWCHGIAEPLSLLVAVKWGTNRGFVERIARWGLGAIALGVLLSLMSWYLAPLAVHLIPALEQELSQLCLTLYMPPGPVKAIPILAMTVLNEELIWRGTLVDWCQGTLSFPKTLLVATVTYTLPIALSGSPLLVAMGVVLGALLTAQRLILRTWVAPFITHLTWTILVFVIHPLACAQ